MRLNRSLSIILLLLGIAVVFFAAAARPSIAHAQDSVAIPIPVRFRRRPPQSRP